MATGSRQAIARSDCSSQVSSSNVHWVDATHYAVDYTVADANTTLASVTFDVSGAKDFDGNTQVAATNVASGTAIDTQNPTVTSVALSDALITDADTRAAEHTSELHSHLNLVCRLLLVESNAGTNLTSPTHAHWVDAT